ncbi:hypothetical protein AYO40_04835 [Planctomycetaceae bacterium SCGC AG-212-D15]|nr:hypothetical protein AYO40_04835 [Planctomycetaceae bacterium SCGC AG-212-D15]
MRLATPASLIAIAILLLGSTLSSAADAPCCPPDLSGRWSGHWESCPTGHCGPLHARFCKIDDCHYRVNFHGRFFKVIPFRYSVTLNVTGTADGVVFLSGEKRLLGFGTFTYQAQATDCSFTATYCSRSDTGRFELTR